MAVSCGSMSVRTELSMSQMARLPVLTAWMKLTVWLVLTASLMGMVPLALCGSCSTESSLARIFSRSTCTQWSSPMNRTPCLTPSVPCVQKVMGAALAYSIRIFHVSTASQEPPLG